MYLYGFLAFEFGLVLKTTFEQENVEEVMLHDFQGYVIKSPITAI